MQRFFLSMAAVSALFSGCNMPTKPSTEMTEPYPESRYDSSDVKTYFGEAVADPYGWLERRPKRGDRSDWVARAKMRSRKTTWARKFPTARPCVSDLTALWNYEKIGAPFVEGAYTY